MLSSLRTVARAPLRVATAAASRRQMAVLKGVPSILTPDLLYMLSSMGHGENL